MKDSIEKRQSNIQYRRHVVWCELMKAARSLLSFELLDQEGQNEGCQTDCVNFVAALLVLSKLERSQETR